MASERRYANTMVDVASVQQFVQGLQQKADEQAKGAAKIIGTGLLTAAALSAYKNRRRS